MNKEEIEKQLKLSKRQNKDERYDYLCSEFNAINYCINLEKYTNMLQQENKKYKEVIDKVLEDIKEYKELGYSKYYENEIEIELIDTILKVLGGA